MRAFHGTAWDLYEPNGDINSGSTWQAFRQVKLSRILSEAIPGNSQRSGVSIEKLRIGLFGRLYALYSGRYGEQAKYLCGALCNHVYVEEPTNEAAKQYRNENRALIASEAGKLHENPQIAMGTGYLYAAQILYLNMSVRSAQ